MTDKRVLKFAAEWCGPCKMLSNVIDGVETDVPIQEIDIDTNQDLAIQYGVRGVPTLIMLEGNTEIKRVSGMMMTKDLETWLND